MSMRNYVVHCTGLLLNNLKVNGEEIDVVVLDELAESGIISQQSLTGETFPWSKTGRVMWSDCEYWDGQTVYYIDLPKCPSFFEQAYSDMRELVKDLKRAYDAARAKDDRLPKLTLKQVRENIREIEGTYCG